MEYLKFSTDLSQPEKMIRSKQVLTSLNQPSQVHEYVVQLVLSRKYKVKGINFVVLDPFRNIVAVQIQMYWWDRYMDRKHWEKVCLEMSRQVSNLMPVGLCNISLQ